VLEVDMSLRIVRRKKDIEFTVNQFDPTGEDIVDQEFFRTLPEAVAALAKASAPAEVEEWTSTWGQLESGDWTLLCREFVTLQERGEPPGAAADK
jgi:hypothetical protein